MLNAMAAVGAPAWQRRAFPILQPAVARLIGLALHRPLGHARAGCRACAAGLRRRRRGARTSPYLVGGRFTAADLAFAALSGPVVFPDGYGPAGALTVEDLGHELRAAVEEWRREPLAAAVRTVYEQHRRAGATP